MANTLINDVLVNKTDPKKALDTAQQHDRIAAAVRRSPR